MRAARWNSIEEYEPRLIRDGPSGSHSRLSIQFKLRFHIYNIDLMIAVARL